MALDKEFVGRLEYEIKSLAARLESLKADNKPEDREAVRGIEAQLVDLKELRRQMVEQSHGG
jgi:hypothetical protein